CMHALAFPWTF
nr:immunoglobulin light chain junction region [Macaca mulatta]MOX23828.1 immunoglobulin light chain junction region [Macaca mulatta]MOX23869.1 immunoglobulin light chain junction region [Macaca mulatta]MOX24081.1 immunoglobulin light chain junction region [Macaca mulatta]MOX24140.1 immunoglobulin light chain junction region [Macaca mulatta]